MNGYWIGGKGERTGGEEEGREEIEMKGKTGRKRGEEACQTEMEGGKEDSE